MQPENLRLHKLVSQWRSEGSPEQEAFPWHVSKPKWVQLAEEFHVNIDDFPDLIDRQFLWGLSSSAAPVRSLFLAVMIWGYGDIGYGAHRVRQMYESKGFDDSIQLVKNLCVEGQSLEAYKTLQKSKIRQLGPSFGSKVLTFFHPSERAPAILDSIVARWLNENALNDFGAKGVNAEIWNPRTYERYINWMNDLSTEFQVPASTLELLIFTDGYNS